MKPTVYIETSVVSYYTSRPSRDLIIAGHQQITTEWMEIVLPLTSVYISPFVINEAQRGDKQAAEKRMRAIEEFDILAINSEVYSLADQYFNMIHLPETARIDTFHLAVASWHEIDYLLSWNCKHIANAKVRRIVWEVNLQLGIRSPIICTPEELMEV